MVVVQQLSVAEATDVPFFPCFESVCILECKLVAKIGFINGIVTLCIRNTVTLTGYKRWRQPTCQRWYQQVVGSNR